MKTIKSFLHFQNSNIAVFDEDGQQIPELQISFYDMWAKHAESLGYNPEGIIIETVSGNWRLFKCADGSYNQEKGRDTHWQLRDDMSKLEQSLHESELRNIYLAIEADLKYRESEASAAALRAALDTIAAKFPKPTEDGRPWPWDTTIVLTPAIRQAIDQARKP